MRQVFDDIALMYPAVKPKKDRDKPQFPDIFVYLVRGGHHIAYLRWTAHELLKMTKEESTAPRWRSFVEEPCLDAFGPGEIPGSLLCSSAARLVCAATSLLVTTAAMMVCSMAMPRGTPLGRRREGTECA